MVGRQRRLWRTTGNGDGRQEEMTVVATEVATQQPQLQQTRGGGESGLGSQEVMMVAACHMWLWGRSGGRDYHFSILHLFLLGDSSKVCVVVVLSGKFILTSTVPSRKVIEEFSLPKGSNQRGQQRFTLVWKTKHKLPHCCPPFGRMGITVTNLSCEGGQYGDQMHKL